MLPFRPIGNKVTRCTQRTVLNGIPISSSIHSIHTKNQKSNMNSMRKHIKSLKTARGFTSIPLPSIPSINIPSITQTIGMLTGNKTMTTKNNRIMERVWEKRRKKLYKNTRVMLEQFEADNIMFDTAQIYIRASGSFDDAEDNAQKEVHIALRGIAHTVVVLQSGSISYLLDRVVEGIRLTELEINPETQSIVKCNKFKPEEMIKLATFNEVNLSSDALAEWIHEEYKSEYNVITNNCVWFSMYFWQHFLCGLKTQQWLHKLCT